MRKLGFIACCVGSILAFISMTGCTDEDGAYNLLMKEGYSDIHITGYEYFACSDSDKYRTGFTATNMKGNKVSGVVCCGYLKACTIRYN